MRSLAPEGQSDRIFTLAELWYPHAERTGFPEQYLAASRNPPPDIGELRKARNQFALLLCTMGFFQQVHGCPIDAARPTQDSVQLSLAVSTTRCTGGGKLKDWNMTVPLQVFAAGVVKYCRRNWMRQCSCRIVPCSRSTKPLVQACRGCVRVCRMPKAWQASSKAALNSEPRSVSTRCSGQPAC